MIFSHTSIDDLMQDIYRCILDEGIEINPSKGNAKEIYGVLLELTDPRARLSRTESRGKAFSCLGELCWYLAKDRTLEFIEYYIPKYRQYADNGIIAGGYGKRLFDWNGINQIENIINRLKDKPESRKAVVQIFDRNDIIELFNDVACTCSLQFMVRENKLHLITYMRSNDACLGLPHDIFCFTMIQEIVARTIGVELGVYKHVVGSLHVYTKDIETVNAYINEGYQSTKHPMPIMPCANPWESIELLLQAESQIRAGKEINFDDYSQLDQYWLDIIRLLIIFNLHKEKEFEKIIEENNRIHSDIYKTFVESKMIKKA